MTHLRFKVSDLLAEQLENYANQTHASIEMIGEPLLQWSMKEFERRLNIIRSKFEVGQLEWFKEHMDVLDLLSVSHPGELVHLLQFLWSDSSFEEETDLSSLFHSLLTLSEDDLFILSWWITQ